MTNAFVASKKKVVGAIDATGASDAIQASPGQLVDVSLDFDTATAFVGTIQI